MITFEQVRFEDLNAKQKEIYNFQKLSATLADYGFNCIKLADDWLGADFLAYHPKGDKTLRVQLKSRITIQKKYEHKDICIAFPYRGFWYLVEHDQLVHKIGKHTHWLESPSWKDLGLFHSDHIKPELLNSLAESKLGPVYGPVLETDEHVGLTPKATQDASSRGLATRQ